MKTFKGSSLLGDTIAGLPAIIKLGGGKLYINIGCIKEERFKMLKPLLESQNYITSLDVWNKEKVDYDMDAWTVLDHAGKLPKGLNMAEVQLYAYNLYYDLTKKWIEVKPLYKKDIVINRTIRYHNPEFNWDEILSFFPKKRILFVGCETEYVEFGHKEIAYHKVKNYLELASIIKGSKLFIGNQSFCWWIAEAMKVNRWLECCPGKLDSMPKGGKSGYFISKSNQVLLNFKAW